MKTSLVRTLSFILLSQTFWNLSFAQANVKADQSAHLVRAEAYQCIYMGSYGYTMQSLGEVDVDYNTSKLSNSKTFSDQSRITLNVVLTNMRIDKKEALSINAEYQTWEKMIYENNQGKMETVYNTFSSPKVIREGLFISKGVSVLPRKDLFCSTVDDLGKIELFIQTM